MTAMDCRTFLVHFSKLATERAGPKRIYRPLRMNGMARRPVKIVAPPGTSAIMVRLAEAMRALEPRSPAHLSEEELVSVWGEELARYYLDRILPRRTPVAATERRT